MEEREMNERIAKVFEETVPILRNIYKGFVTQKIGLVKDSRVQFRESLKRRLPEVEKLVEMKEKSEAETKFLILLPHLQRVALAIDSLCDKMEAKVEGNILFTQKALDELKELMETVGAEFIEVKDYVSTKDRALKDQIRAHRDAVWQRIADFDLVHQNRLITGVCMPQASYLYIDMTDSLKRMATELNAFAEIM
jgi:Na+/phosphate symporter